MAGVNGPVGLIQWAPHAAPAVIPAALFAWFVTLGGPVADGIVVLWRLDWAPSLGVALAFRLDGLGLTFALLITGIGALVMLYAARYLAGDAHVGRTQAVLLLFMASMLGLVLADDLILLFVCWELTGITSWLLIGYNHTEPGPRRSAQHALLITVAGGLALFAGLVLLAAIGGQGTLTGLLSQGPLVDHPGYLPVLALVLVGAFTKSAQVPLHFWLPGAMAAPTPISAYLHSATMVKAGVYLLARLMPVLGGTDVWIWTLTLTGAATAVLSSIWALRQDDLKLMLAYTTLMGLGTLVMFLGSGAAVGVVAAVTFLIVHALYKAALFMVVGNMDFATGTRDRHHLGGLAAVMPWTAMAALMAGFSMAGFPPFLGFMGKELKYEGALAVAAEPILVVASAVSANALMVTVAGIVAFGPFWRHRARRGAAVREVPVAMLAGPMLLAVAGFLMGTDPDLLELHLIGPAVSVMTGEPIRVELKLWHGVNVPLLLSTVTFALGVTLYLLQRPVRQLLGHWDDLMPTSTAEMFDHLVAGLRRLALWQTRHLITGRVRDHQFVVIAVLVVAGFGVAAAVDGLALPIGAFDPPGPLGMVLGALTMAAALVAAAAPSRLMAICALGVVGTAVALLFLLHGGVDVAITQLLVEILVLVVVSVAFLKLPRINRVAWPRRRHAPASAVVALGSGVGTTALLLEVFARPPERVVSAFYEAASVPLGHGRNIVNVILVDFRALDTFGEISVIATSGLAATALLGFGLGRRRAARLRRKREGA